MPGNPQRIFPVEGAQNPSPHRTGGPWEDCAASLSVALSMGPNGVKRTPEPIAHGPPDSTATSPTHAADPRQARKPSRTSPDAVLPPAGRRVATGCGSHCRGHWGV